MDYRNQWIDPPRLPRAMARSNKEWAFGFTRMFKLLRQLLRQAAGADQDHLATEFRWVGWSRLRSWTP